MDLTYFYYQFWIHYYKFTIYKLKFADSWTKLSRTTKSIYCCSVCFGSAFAGWLVFKLLERRWLSIPNIEEVDDVDDQTIKSKRRKNGIPPGLFNDGNTCFLNCVLQALASCPSFYNWTCEVLNHYGYSDVTLFPSIHKLLKVLTNTTGNENIYSTGDVMAHSVHMDGSYPINNRMLMSSSKF